MSDFISQIKTQKEKLLPFIENFFKQEREKYQDFYFGNEVLKKLETFSKSGKLARASLFLLAYQNLKDNDPAFAKQVLLPIATAIELIHSTLLIHDDVIDLDRKRRGFDSIWQQYNLSENDEHYGKSQAICVGDLSFFLAQSLISQAMANLVHFPGLHGKNALQISQLINYEINQVVLAEMLDVKLAIQKEDPSKEEILEMYQYKTARYTFSLPLILAAKLAEQTNQEIKKLTQIGEKIGLIFQIQDDYLDIFGDTNITGKPIAGDLKEGKRTIIYHNLINNSKLKESHKKRFQNIFGQSKINKEDLLWSQNLIREFAWPETEKIITQFKDETEELISQFENKKVSQLLGSTLTFSYQRKK